LDAWWCRGGVSVTGGERAVVRGGLPPLGHREKGDATDQNGHFVPGDVLFISFLFV
jgi:hypothetical protein